MPTGYGQPTSVSYGTICSDQKYGEDIEGRHHGLTTTAVVVMIAFAVSVACIKKSHQLHLAGVVKGLMLVAEARLKFADSLAIQQNQSMPTGVGEKRKERLQNYVQLDKLTSAWSEALLWKQDSKDNNLFHWFLSCHILYTPRYFILSP